MPANNNNPLVDTIISPFQPLLFVCFKPMDGLWAG